MSEVAGKLAMFITANAGSFNRVLSGAQKTLQDFSKNVSNIGKDLSIGLTAPLVGFAAKAVSEFQDTQQALSQVEAGLRSTGNAAGFSAGELEKMAKSLQGNSIFSDDEILKGVTSQLLTFTNISGKAFEGAQQAAVDLSARLGQDLQSSAIQLGKALNDPVKGLTALGRVGVQFSEEQKNLIKSFVESGKIAEAQGVILAELNTEFGGSAEAALNASGGLIGLRNSFNDLAETVGGVLAPYLSKLSEFLKGVFDRFQALSPEAQKIVVAVGGVAAAIGPLLIGFGKLSSMLASGGSLSAGFTALKVAVTAISGPVAIAVAAIAAAAALIIANWDSVSAYFTTGPGAKIFDTVSQVFQKLYDVVTSIIGALVEVVMSLWDSFGDDFVAIVGAAMDGVFQILSFALDGIIAVIDFFRAAFEGNWQGAWDVVETIWQKSMNFLIQFLADKLKNILDLVDKTFSVFGQDDFVDPAINAIQTLADAFKFDVPEAAETAKVSVEDFTNKVQSGIGKSIEDANELGKALDKAVNRRVDTSQIAPISSTGTDGLQLPGATGSEQATLAVPATTEMEAAVAVQTELNAVTLESIAASQEAMSAYEQLGNTIGSTFSEAGQTIGDYFKTVVRAIGNSVRSIIKIFLAQAVAGYISKVVATFGPLGLALAAAAPGIVGGLFDALIPAFAQGGMVTGPQLALVGDNPSGKEAIIPFEKMGSFLNQFAGGGQQVIVLDTVLKGNELLLTMREAQKNNVRTYGRELI